MMSALFVRRFSYQIRVRVILLVIYAFPVGILILMRELLSYEKDVEVDAGCVY